MPTGHVRIWAVHQREIAGALSAFRAWEAPISQLNRLFPRGLNVDKQPAIGGQRRLSAIRAIAQADVSWLFAIDLKEDIAPLHSAR
jgi:hypothetical protein